MSGFVHVERVRFGDLDAMRHLNNVVFLRYFETARIAFIRDLLPAHDPAAPDNGGYGVIFAECHINYRSPVHFDEQVAIECSVSDVARSSFRVPFRMSVVSMLANLMIEANRFEATAPALDSAVADPKAQ